MSCTILTQINIKDQIEIQTPSYPENIPDLLKISKKKLKRSCDSLLDFLSNSSASEIFQLKLGKFKLNLQLKENPFPSKSYLSSSISSFFSDISTTENLSWFPESTKVDQLSPADPLIKIEDYSEVFNYVTSTESIRAIKSIKKLAERLQSTLASVEKKTQKILEKTKENSSTSSNRLSEDIKSIRDEIEELTAQLNFTDKDHEKELIEMEITRKNTRLNEMRSKNILALSESRKKIYQNALRCGKGSDARQVFSNSCSKLQGSAESLTIFSKMTKELEELIALTRDLRRILVDFIDQ